MPPEKARKILREYPLNHYNAKKTLMANGYTEQSAEKASTTIMARAVKAVAKDIANTPLEDIRKKTRSSMEILGLSTDDVSSTLRKIAMNDRDYASALKVLRVLAKEIGVHLDEEEAKAQPLLNITVESGNSDKEPDNITGHLSSNVVEKTAGDTAASYVENVDECQEVLGDGEGDIGEEEGER